MNLITILALALPLSFSLVNNKNVNTKAIDLFCYADDFDHIYVAPYENGNLKITFDVSFNKSVGKVTRNINIYTSYVIKDGSSVSNSYRVDSTSLYHCFYTYTIKLEHSYVDDVKVRILITYSSGQAVCSRDFIARKVGCDYLTSAKISSGSYSPVTSAYSYSHNAGEKYITEKFEFNNFGGAYAYLEHNYVDFSEFKINRVVDSVNTNISCSSAYATFYNYDNVFDNFSTLSESKMYCTIPLTLLNDEDNNYYLSPTNNLYVNPFTREISDTKLDGYVPTKYLFLPINYLYQFYYRTNSIKITEIGISKSYIVYNYSFYQGAKLFGDRGNVAYYIESEIANAEFGIGKVYNH